MSASPEPTPEQATITHVRASTLSGMLHEIDAQGPEAREVLIASLSPPAQRVLRELLGVFQWVETPVVNELVTVYEERYGRADIERRVSYTARQQLTVVHAWMLRLLTPETVFHQASTLFRFYYRGGVARAEEVRSGHARVAVWARGLYPSWYTHALPLWIAGALRLIGAQSPQVTHQAAATGFLHSYEIDWIR